MNQAEDTKGAVMRRLNVLWGFIRKVLGMAVKGVGWLWHAVMELMVLIRSATNWLVDCTRKYPVFMTLVALGAVCWSLLGRILGVWSLLPVLVAAISLVLPKTSHVDRGGKSDAGKTVVEAEWREETEKKDC